MLRWFSQKRSVKVLGYCLMSNHVHLIIEPEVEESLGLTIHDTHVTYAQYANKAFGRTGHLFEGRYYSCAMDDDHCVAALRYVEQNPVRAGMVNWPWQYPWSSVKAHVEGSDPKTILDFEWINARFSPIEWKEFIKAPEMDGMIDSIRKGTKSGRPVGNQQFIAGLEKNFGLDLRIPKPGRPKKGTGPLF
jgi:putative transposase